MATFVLIHGASNSALHWHLVTAELHARGHEVIAVDLPCDDDSADFADYADTVVEAVGDRRNVIVVAHSLGGFTAPLVCHRVAASLLVLVAGMVPAPGEAPGDWFANTGHAQARQEQDDRDGRDPDDNSTLFMLDVPPEVAAADLARSRAQSGTPFSRPWPLDAWPRVPTRFLLCRDDRFFPAEFMRRIARDRLGITADEMDGSHSVALSRPLELVDRLEKYRIEAGR